MDTILKTEELSITSQIIVEALQDFEAVISDLSSTEAQRQGAVAVVTAFNNYRETHGSMETRSRIFELAQAMDKAFNQFESDDIFDSIGCYDFEWVPLMISRIVAADWTLASDEGAQRIARIQTWADLIEQETVKELSPSENEYRCLAISTHHVTEADSQHLDIDSASPGMTMKRDTGWFLKLYEEWDSNEPLIHRLSPGLVKVIRWCHRKGYRLIEIDCDAPEVKL